MLALSDGDGDGAAGVLLQAKAGVGAGLARWDDVDAVPDIQGSVIPAPAPVLAAVAEVALAISLLFPSTNASKSPPSLPFAPSNPSNMGASPKLMKSFLEAAEGALALESSCSLRVCSVSILLPRLRIKCMYAWNCVRCYQNQRARSHDCSPGRLHLHR